VRGYRLLMVTAIVAVVAFSSPLVAQSATPAQGPQDTGSSGDFNPRDFTGLWFRSGPGRGDRGFGPPGSMPPMTPAGEARARTHIPHRGTRVDFMTASDFPGESNDPTVRCDPTGFPRILVDTAPELFEFVHTESRILQLIQWERGLRELWMDGREVPSGENLDNLGPSWYGHSVAHWEEDTLVVNTVGMNDRAWLDPFGLPKSFGARIEERYRLADRDTLELQLTLYDPEYYTEPWVSDIKRWRRDPPENQTFYGWYGLFSGIGDLICAPSVNAIFETD
jgi:hypothetical protein